MKLDFAPSPEAEKKARAIIDRLKAEYPDGRFFCICDCHDSSLTKEGGEIWQNYELIKVFFPDRNRMVVFISDCCPICGKKLPTPDGGRQSNGMKLI